MNLIGNWNYPDQRALRRRPHSRARRRRQGGRHGAAAAGHRSAAWPRCRSSSGRCEVLADEGVAASSVLRRPAQSGRGQRRGRSQGADAAAGMTASSPSAAARPRCRQGHRLHGGPDAPDVGLRGCRRLVDPRRRQGDPADRRRADHGGHGLRGRPRRRHHRRGDAHQRR